MGSQPQSISVLSKVDLQIEMSELNLRQMAICRNSRIPHSQESKFSKNELSTSSFAAVTRSEKLSCCADHKTPAKRPRTKAIPSHPEERQGRCQALNAVR